MAIRTVQLEDDEWQVVMNALIAQNPVLMKMAAQLSAQQHPQPPIKQDIRRDGDGKEVRP